MPQYPVERTATVAKENAAVAASQEDFSLLARMEQGDGTALGRLYECHSRIVYSVAVRVLRDASAAEDVLQDVFLQLWRKPSTFVATRGSLSGWLAVVARNRSIDVLRSRRPTTPIDEIRLESPTNHSNEVERALMIEKIRMLIAKLPIAQQKVLELAFFKEWTHAEIAAYSHVPLGTIKSRIRAALQTLEKKLEEHKSLAIRGSICFATSRNHPLSATNTLSVSASHF